MQCHCWLFRWVACLGSTCRAAGLGFLKDWPLTQPMPCDAMSGYSTRLQEPRWSLYFTYLGSFKQALIVPLESDPHRFGCTGVYVKECELMCSEHTYQRCAAALGACVGKRGVARLALADAVPSACCTFMQCPCALKHPQPISTASTAGQAAAASPAWPVARRARWVARRVGRRLRLCQLRQAPCSCCNAKVPNSFPTDC